VHLRHTAAILHDEINPTYMTGAISCITEVCRHMSIREMLTDDSAAFRFFFVFLVLFLLCPCIQSLGISQEHYAPVTSNHYLYHSLFTRFFFLRYPEGNFGGNQLLNGSIGLSPLYSDLMNDLHVSIMSAFHQGFPWFQPIQA